MQSSPVDGAVVIITGNTPRGSVNCTHGRGSKKYPTQGSVFDFPSITTIMNRASILRMKAADADVGMQLQVSTPRNLVFPSISFLSIGSVPPTEALRLANFDRSDGRIRAARSCG